MKLLNYYYYEQNSSIEFHGNIILLYRAIEVQNIVPSTKCIVLVIIVLINTSYC